MDKKGVSKSFIVILIAIAVICAIMIFLIVFFNLLPKYVEEQFGIELVSEELEVSIINFESDLISFSIKNLRNDKNVESLEFVLENENEERYNLEVLIRPLETDVISVDISNSSLENIAKISIFPTFSADSHGLILLCGDGNCTENETCWTCEQDCGICSRGSGGSGDGGSGNNCGDGAVEGGEFCDSNSQSCTINGYLGTQNCLSDCSGFDTCVTTEYCGDGIVNGNEDCEDGNFISGDGCSPNCEEEGAVICEPNTYYVDSVNGNDANNGTCSDSAWQTVSKVNSESFVAGDSIKFVRGGQADQTLTLLGSSGELGNPIKIESYGLGNKPIFPTGVEFTGNKYINLSDFTVQWLGFTIKLIGTEEIVLDNVTIINGGELSPAGILIASTSSGCKNNIVKNSEIISTHGGIWQEGGCSVTIEGHGILIAGWSDEGCSGNKLINNMIYDNDGGGITVNGNTTKTYISGNEIYNNNAHGIHVAETSETVIERNVVYENSQGLDDAYGIDLIAIEENNIVRYNVVHDQHDSKSDPGITPACEAAEALGNGGIRFDGIRSDETLPEFQHHWYGDSLGNIAHHNLVYNERYGLEVVNYDNTEIYNNVFNNTFEYGIVVSGLNGHTTANTKIKNNIFSEANNSWIELIDTLGDEEIDYNLYWGESWSALPGQDANSINEDPLFIDEVFHLDILSLAFGAGTSVELTEDFDSNAISSGSESIGAYEPEILLSPIVERNFFERFVDWVKGLFR